MRVTDMRGVDLSVYRFDYGLTFAALFMHPDGHVYHDYGNRTPQSATSALSMASLERAMRSSIRAHDERKYQQELAEEQPPAPTARGPSISVEQLPTMARRIEAGKAPDCFHCHMVNQAYDEEAEELGAFDPAVVWRYPPSTRIGLHLDRDEPSLVAAVDKDSPAALSGIRAGDRLRSFGSRSEPTEGDVQWSLESARTEGTGVIAVRLLRGEEELELPLVLSGDWAVGTPEELWRPTMWRLDPRPGFGGPLLDAAQKKELGIADAVSALRVNYIVTWGTHARTGKNAQRAGLRKNDVVLSVAGKDDFASPAHFHAWFRLTRVVGEVVPIVVLRAGDRKELELTVIE